MFSAKCKVQSTEYKVQSGKGKGMSREDLVLDLDLKHETLPPMTWSDKFWYNNKSVLILHFAEEYP
jgi:hypothetical protein